MDATTELILGAERERQDRLEKKRLQQIREEELRRQREEEKVRQIEAAKVHDLLEGLKQWNLANSLTEYLEAVEAIANEQGADTAATSNFRRWLEWARNYAAGLEKTATEDPLKNLRE